MRPVQRGHPGPECHPTPGRQVARASFGPNRRDLRSSSATAARTTTWPGASQIFCGKATSVSFLDFDPEVGIPGGRAWEEELYSKLRTTQALVFLGTEHSIESKWVFAELVVARSIQKPIIPLPVGGARLSLVDDTQWIDWGEDDAAIARLRRALEELDIEALPFDPNRPPYPGLEAFDEDDAALFFGRSAKKSLP